jgi:hypothetical protein
MLIKIDASGNFEWSRTYGEELDQAKYLFPTKDGGYAFVGQRGDDIASSFWGQVTTFKSWVLLAKIRPISTITLVEPVFGTFSIISPKNQTYWTNDIPLLVTCREPPSWISYSLDGESTVTVTGNTTLARVSNGLHSLTIYLPDIDGNISRSETVQFTVAREAETMVLEASTWMVPPLFLMTIASAMAYRRKGKDHVN